MDDNLNRVKNPRFALDGRAPRSWSWTPGGSQSRWSIQPVEQQPAAHEPSGPIIRIESAGGTQGAFWSQTIRCKAKQNYRLEADVRADCRAESSDSGLVLSVHFPNAGDAEEHPTLRMPPIGRASAPVMLRGYFQTPDSARALELRIGLFGAAGWACIHEVRLIAVLEPDAKGHVLALPPPAHADVPRPVARRIVVCTRADRPQSLLDILGVRFCDDAVEIAKPGKFIPSSLGGGDAVLLLDSAAPRSLRTLRALESLARDRVVVISVAAFARLARLQIRRIEQTDDPLHAAVNCACFITRGFALHDVFPFASCGDAPGSFAQNQFRGGKAVREFCDRRGYQVLLTAVTDQDQTMDKPIALWKQTPGGGLIVCDLDPLHASSSTLAESSLAAVLLLNMLGCEQAILGQYVTPVRSARLFHEQLSDFAAYYPALELSGCDCADAALDGALVRVGRESQSFGLPLPERPAVLIRTGLKPGDEDGIYGAMLWLKRLVRPLPYLGPHAARLAGRFSLIWKPLGRLWSHTATGFQPVLPADKETGTAGDEEIRVPAKLRALIDITNGPTDSFRVVFPRAGAFQQHCARALPALAAAMGQYRFIAPQTAAGSPPGDLDARGWRRVDAVPDVVVDDSAFGDPIHAAALQAGAALLRIETPPGATDLMADSIWRTDLAACTLDWVAGMLWGTLVMNHRAYDVELDPTLILAESCHEFALWSADSKTGQIVEERRSSDGAASLRMGPGVALCTLC